MRPDPPPLSRRARAAAARTSLSADLGWLRGFPADAPPDGADDEGELRRVVRWWTVPPLGRGRPPQLLLVDDETLVAARRALAQLPRRIPEALLDEAGPAAGALMRSAPARLDALAAALRTGRPPRLPGEVRGEPEVVRLLRWLHAGDAGRLDAALAVAGEHARALQVVTDGCFDQGASAARVVELALDRPREAGPLLRLLDDPRAGQPLCGPSDGLQRAIEALRRGAVPPPLAAAKDGKPLAPRAVEALALACDLPPEQRRAALTLALAALPLDRLAAWAGWWTEARAAVDAAREAARGPISSAASALERLQRVAAQRPGPRPWRPEPDWAGVRRLATEPEVCERLVRLVAALPGDGLAPTRAAALDHALAALRARRGVARISGALALVGRAVAAARRAGVDGEALAGAMDWLADDVLGELLGPRAPGHARRLEPLDPGGTAGALVGLATGGRRELADLDALLEVAARTGDPARGLAFVRALPAEGAPEPGGWDGQADLRRDAFFALAGEDPRALAAAVRALGRRLDAARCRGLLALCRDPDERRRLAEAVALGEGRAVRGLLAAAGLVASIGAACPSPPAVDRAPALEPALPPAAAPVVARLVRAGGARGASVRRTLARLAPAPAALGRELVAVRERLAAAADPDRRVALTARAARLERRLAGAAPLPPRRARAAARRLAGRAVRLELAAWSARLRDALAARLAELLGSAPPADWLDDPRRRAVLDALLALGKPWRPAALALLRARLGPPPWDLRGHGANRAFLDSLRARGVEPAAWLDGVPAREGTLPDGAPLRVALEADPLEALRLGAPFGTCLAPDGENFHGAAAAAVDVNKRVVYGRAADGRVVGRCLLGLTDEGAVVTYHAYGTADAPGFPALAVELALDLAARLGTCVAAAGRVRSLVAPEQYLDAPESLAASLPRVEAALAAVEAELHPPASRRPPAGGVAAADDEAARAARVRAALVDRLGEPDLRRLAPALVAARTELAAALAADLDRREVPGAARLAAAAKLGQGGRSLRLGLVRDGGWRPLCVRERSELAEALLGDGEPAAALRVSGAGPRPWCDCDLARLRGLASRARLALREAA